MRCTFNRPRRKALLRTVAPPLAPLLAHIQTQTNVHLHLDITVCNHNHKYVGISSKEYYKKSFFTNYTAIPTPAANPTTPSKTPLQMLSRLKQMDMYRSIPKDLTEATSTGYIFSLISLFFILVVFVCEVYAFFSVSYVTSMKADQYGNEKLLINFNISMLRVPCQYASIDVYDVLGNREFHIVSPAIVKREVNEDGLLGAYHSIHMKDVEIFHEEIHNEEEIFANGIHATPLEQGSFDDWLENHEYTIIDYYAPWCVWCQRLEPVWEAFAESIEASSYSSVSVVKVDCVANKELCQYQAILGYPTIKLYNRRMIKNPDYSGDRTVDAFMEFIKSRVANDKAIKTAVVTDTDVRSKSNGCNLEGTIAVNRVPGYFHIESYSEHHQIDATLANLSHAVHHLSFGANPLVTTDMASKLQYIGKEYFSYDAVTPMNDRWYVTEELHQSFHHYLKIVSTWIDFNGNEEFDYSNDAYLTYQLTAASQIMSYSNKDDVPNARFSYDLSPVDIRVTLKAKQWYSFITKVLALTGGTFTVLSIFFSTLGSVISKKKM